MNPQNLSSQHIENKMFTITSENLSNEDCFDTKLQAKVDKYDNFFKQQEEECIS